jgi:group I intron endonuclease
MRFIYKITNVVNGKVYIGQAANPKNRWSQHKMKAKSEKPTMLVNVVMKRYGIVNFLFEIIASCLDVDAANDAEERIIKQERSHVSLGNGYNVSLGGSVAPKSEEWKTKMSQLNKRKFEHDPKCIERLTAGKNAYRALMKQNNERIPCGFSPGMEVSISTREKLREAARRRTPSQIEIEKRKKSLKEWHSCNQKPKRIVSDEQKNNISISLKNKKRLNGIQREEILEKFRSGLNINQLAAEYNVAHKTIKRIIHKDSQ